MEYKQPHGVETIRNSPLLPACPLLTSLLLMISSLAFLGAAIAPYSSSPLSPQLRAPLRWRVLRI